MEDYQSNSKLPKEVEKPPERKIERIVTGEVIQRKKSFVSKVRDVFFGGDFKTAIRYVGGDVLLPMARDMLFQTLMTSAERTIYPDRYGSRPPHMGSRFSYNSLPERRYPPDPRERWDPRGRIPDQSSRRSYRSNRRDADDFIVPSRAIAEAVVEDMFKQLERYQVVTLGNLKEMLGIETSYIDEKWGWTYLHNVQIRQHRDGYLIDLPPMEDV